MYRIRSIYGLPNSWILDLCPGKKVYMYKPRKCYILNRDRAYPWFITHTFQTKPSDGKNAVARDECKRSVKNQVQFFFYQVKIRGYPFSLDRTIIKSTPQFNVFR